MPDEAAPATISLQDAVTIGVLTRDLDEIASLKACGAKEIPSSFLDCQDDDVRVASWMAALDTAEAMIRAKLREKGVDA